MFEVLNKKNIVSIKSFVLIAIVTGFQLFTFFIPDEVEGNSVYSIYYRISFVIICFLAILSEGIKFRNRYPFSLILFYFFWAFYIVHGLFDTFLVTRLDSSLSIRFWAFAFFLCFIPSLVLSAKFKVGELKFAEYGIFTVVLLVNILGFVRNISDVSAAVKTRYDANNLLSTIHYGQAAAVLVILSLMYLVKCKLIIKPFLVLPIAIGLANIFIAASRGPLLQLAVAVLILLYSQIKSGRLIIILFSIIIIFLLLGSVHSIVSTDGLLTRLLETSSDEERSEIYQRSFTLFVNNPLFGAGVLDEWAHNIILGAFEGMGILGGLFITFITIFTIRNIFKLNGGNSTQWVALILAIYFVGSLFAGSLWNAVILWPLIALANNLVSNLRHKC
jgi:O-antigen ligase